MCKRYAWEIFVRYVLPPRRLIHDAISQNNQSIAYPPEEWRRGIPAMVAKSIVSHIIWHSYGFARKWNRRKIDSSFEGVHAPRPGKRPIVSA